jgi:hypothetical protein
MTLTIGSGITIRGGNTFGNSTGGSVIGFSGYYGGGNNTSIVNLGTIAADGAAGTALWINPRGATFTNNGTVTATNSGGLVIAGMSGSLAGITLAGSGSTLSVTGDGYSNAATFTVPAGNSLTLGGTWSNTGTLDVVGGTLTLDGTWSNSGQIQATGATVNLDGTFTTQGVGTLSRVGGTINVTGTMVNTNAVLTLNAATGDWRLFGGTIRGGSITLIDGAMLLMTTTSSSTLDGVTVNGPLDLSATSSQLSVLNGLTLNGTLTLGAFAAVRFNGGSQTLGGTGTVVFTNNIYQGLIASANSMTLTIGSGITIRGGNTFGNSTGGSVIGFSGYYGGGNNTSIVNFGTIAADGAAGTALWVNPRISTFTNNGTIRAAAGATLNVTSLINAATVDVQATGLLLATGDVVQTSGTFTLAIAAAVDPTGTFLLQGGVLSGVGTIRSSLSNSGGTIRPGGEGAAGKLRVEGTFGQSGAGVLAVELGGTVVHTQYDLLEATGAASLGGTISVATINGYSVPVAGIRFAVLTYASRTGSFVNSLGFTLSNGVGLTADYAAISYGLLSTLVDTTPPTLVSHSPVGLVNQPWTTLRVQFSEPMNAFSFTGDDVTIGGPAGVISSLLISVVPVDETTFDITFPQQALDGLYSFVVGPAIQDIAGNPMAAAYSGSVTLDLTGPRIIASNWAGQSPSPLSSVDVTFDGPIVVATLGASDAVLVRPDGSTVTATGVALVSGTTYRFTFVAQTQAGVYTARIGPDVRDAAGNQMDQNANGIRGEVPDDAFEVTTALLAADLVVLDVTVTGDSTGLVTIAWVDRNEGTGATGVSWFDRVRIVAASGATLLDTHVQRDANVVGHIAGDGGCHRPPGRVQPGGHGREQQHRYRVGELSLRALSESGGDFGDSAGGGILRPVRAGVMDRDEHGHGVNLWNVDGPGVSLGGPVGGD